MEHIKVALEKAHASQSKPKNQGIVTAMESRDASETAVRSQHITFSSPCQVQLDSSHLEKNRIVSHDMNDPSHMAFNILRTKIYSTMRSNGWNSIAISSPGPECGKTMVSTNLAFSLARQENCKTVLVDLDLRRPSVANTLGIQGFKSLIEYLTGTINIEECFIKASENLIVLINDQPIRNSSEVMLQQRCRGIVQELQKTLAPDIVLFDLPPMLSSDDTMGFLPFVDTSILVIAEGTSTYKDVEECDSKLDNVDNFMGHVLNKSVDQSEMAYSYYK